MAYVWKALYLQDVSFSGTQDASLVFSFYDYVCVYPTDVERVSLANVYLNLRYDSD